MRLVQVLAIVLTQLSIGLMLFASVLPPRTIRLGLFRVSSLLGAVSAALAWVLCRFVLREAWTDMRFLGLAIIGATVAYGLFRLEKPAGGRLFLVLSGLGGLILGLLPLADRLMAQRGLRTDMHWFFDGSVLCGMLLLGASVVSVILSHWYRLMRHLSFEHLRRFTRYLLGAAGLRLLVLIVTLVWLPKLDRPIADAVIQPLWAGGKYLFLFLIRIAAGLVVPLGLGLLALKQVDDEADQSAMGVLYLIVLSVLGGELLAAYLLV